LPPFVFARGNVDKVLEETAVVGKTLLRNYHVGYHLPVVLHQLQSVRTPKQQSAALIANAQLRPVAYALADQRMARH
jgi:hypothetical protein